VRWKYDSRRFFSAARPPFRDIGRTTRGGIYSRENAPRVPSRTEITRVRKRRRAFDQKAARIQIVLENTPRPFQTKAYPYQCTEISRVLARPTDWRNNNVPANRLLIPLRQVYRFGLFRVRDGTVPAKAFVQFDGPIDRLAGIRRMPQARTCA
jgi:hypothetical protein